MWQFNELTFGEERWWELHHLKKLLLSSNQISSFDYEAFRAKQAAVKTVQPVESDSADPYERSERPPFVELAHLDLSANQLSTLGESIWSSTALTHLNLSHNSFILLQVPQVDACDSNLSTLNVSHNEKLAKIGDGSLHRFVNLTQLHLNNNALPVLPADLFVHLSKLRQLRLSYNKLAELPAADANWTALAASLIEIDLEYNQLKSLPTGFKNLTALTKLSAHHNRLSSLPDLSTCDRLSELVLFSNALSYLPSWFCSLKALQTASLSENSISSLPVGITTMSNLQRLDVGANDLSDVPAELGRMTQLRVLNLQQNPLRGWKASVIDGPTEQILQYLFNRLPVPSEAGSGAASSSSASGSVFVPDNGIVLLSKQKLSALAVGAFSSASALKVRTLKLDQNNLSSLLESVVSQLVNMNTLDVSGNKALSDLSSGIAACTALTSLSAFWSTLLPCQFPL